MDRYMGVTLVFVLQYIHIQTHALLNTPLRVHATGTRSRRLRGHIWGEEIV